MPDEATHSIYLEDIRREVAWDRFIQALDQVSCASALASETLPLEHALDRVTAAPIWAHRSSPHYHAAAMDGYALRSMDTEGVNDRNPRKIALDADCMYVNTGDALPDWSDAVLPIELVEELQGEQAIRIFQAVPPWFNVRPMGEDIVTTELIIPAWHTIRPIDLGAIAASGHVEVDVVRQPGVAIIPTGSELVPLGDEPESGEIPEFNSLMLSAQVEGWGARATRWKIVPDEPAALRQAVLEASIDHDLILINAGSSAGSEDYTANTIAALGKVFVHGVAVRPGHPVILGLITKNEQGKKIRKPVPVIGVPGYPVSAALTADIFVQPLLSLWRGQSPATTPTLKARLTRKLHSTAGDEEHVRVTLGNVAGDWVAAPLSRGAGVISSLVRADGILVVPPGTQGIQVGEIVDVRLLRTRQELDHTILILGSHDLTLDLLAQYVAARNRRLSSNNIGSIGGLIALQRGESHLGGCHLLDPETGEYNIAYVEQYLPGVPTTLVTLVRREQGLILQRGNPKSISGLQDLQREDVMFINRQKGSGTRLLLDHLLKLSDIPATAIKGYKHEEYTHLTVASAIASGKADCGLGIRAAASALDLEFIPLESERYDLVIPTEGLNEPLIQPLIDQLYNPEFKQAAESLDGYDATPMGEMTSIHEV